MGIDFGNDVGTRATLYKLDANGEILDSYYGELFAVDLKTNEAFQRWPVDGEAVAIRYEGQSAKCTAPITKCVVASSITEGNETQILSMHLVTKTGQTWFLDLDRDETEGALWN